MKELISHIEFLILQHEYVIIPNLGGFVLNIEHARIHESGNITAPRLKLGFNSDLKFNDGLLAESYMRRHAMSYDTALLRIEEDVKRIKSMLITQHSLTFGGLGVLKFVDDYLVFEPFTHDFLNHPAVWGYSDVELKRLTEIAVPALKELQGRKIKLRHIVAGVGSTAAAVVLWAMSGAINDNIFHTMQQSGFFVNNVEVMAKKIEDKPVVSAVERDIILTEYLENMKASDEKMETLDVVQEEIVPVVKAPKITEVKEKRYYIIVGGEENKGRANALLSKLKGKGFKNAAIVESTDRYRIYVAMFKDKSEANVFLSRFRSKHPGFNDAWLYTKTVTVKG